jgi:predicted RNase H-like HicB family nuclease
LPGRDALTARFVLTDDVDQALAQAVYDKLDDGTFAGRVPAGPGAVAFGTTLRACEDELRSVLEDWILVGLKLRHPLPVIGGIDLNQEPLLEPVDAL